MRHRSSHNDRGSQKSEPQRHLNQNVATSNPRKPQSIREYKDWTVPLKFGRLLFMICIVMLVVVHTWRHNIHNQRTLIRKGLKTSSDLTLNYVDGAHTMSDKCRFYGCAIIATEISQLESTNFTDNTSIFISSSHLILTHKSNRKMPAPVNQDRAILISPFVPEGIGNRQLQHRNLPNENFLMGIFDGHDNAGDVVAQFSMNEIPIRIAHELKDVKTIQYDGAINSTINQDMVKEAIIKAHEQVDVALPLEQSIIGGCTANVILRLGSTLYMSNVGDSYSYLVTYTPPVDELPVNLLNINEDDLQPHLKGSIVIHHENTRHKPHLPDENLRIKSLGGRVHIPPSPKSPMGSRVIVKSTAHNEDVGLAMSRSIGDADFTKVGVIPTPNVEVVDLKKLFGEIDKSSKVFVVTASDGLFDNRKKEFVTKHLAYVLYESVSATGIEDSMLHGARRLITAASPLQSEWYRDDISFVAKSIEL